MNTKTVRDVYELVTAEIIALFKEGIIPWRYPWGSSGIPRNPVQNIPYRGINVWLLAGLGYETNLFLSWEEVRTMNGSVKKGEHGHIIVAEQTQPRKYGSLPGDDLPHLRYTTVFNIEQCTGIDHTLFPDPPALIRPDRIYPAMPNPPRLIAGIKGTYDHARDVAFELQLPIDICTHAYYHHLFLALVKSTCHHTRCGWLLESPFIHEVIGELGMWQLIHMTGIPIPEEKETAETCNNWIKRLQVDRFFLIHAATVAQHAIDYILIAHTRQDETK